MDEHVHTQLPLADTRLGEDEMRLGTVDFVLLTLCPRPELQCTCPQAQVSHRALSLPQLQIQCPK